METETLQSLAIKAYHGFNVWKWEKDFDGVLINSIDDTKIEELSPSAKQAVIDYSSKVMYCTMGAKNCGDTACHAVSQQMWIVAISAADLACAYENQIGVTTGWELFANAVRKTAKEAGHKSKRYIHETAKVSKLAILHEDVDIRENVVVGDYSVIGKDVILLKDVVVEDNVTLGEAVVLYDGAFIRSKAFLSEGCVVGAGGRVGRRSRLGRYVYLESHAKVGTDERIRDGEIIYRHISYDR